MTSTTPTELYRAARDELLAARTDPARAASFTWPRVEGPFNWAIDWFDPMARGNDRPALIVVDDDETHHERTFDELARRSDQLAAWLASQGVRTGDAALLMLGNQVELWESMLAIMKLGGVIAPTTTALGPGDLADRIARAEIRHVIVGSADADKFDDAPAELGRVVVGEARSGWARYDDAFEADAPPCVGDDRGHLGLPVSVADVEAPRALHVRDDLRVKGLPGRHDLAQSTATTREVGLDEHAPHGRRRAERRHAIALEFGQQPVGREP